MILSLLRICDLNYTRNSEIQHLLDEREDILKLELKLQEQELQGQPHSPAPVPQPALASPGIIDRDEEEAILSSMTRPAAMQAMPSSSSSLSRFMVGATDLASIPEASSASSAPANVSSASAIPDPSSSMSATEMHANLAMIADGSRYTPAQTHGDHNQLPPYSPGNRRTMDGHGDESNEIRLSDYVKGETRAQDMKDGGSYQ